MRVWNICPEKHLQAVLYVAQTLVPTDQRKNVIGHVDIAPGRKLISGAAFPMAAFRSALFGRQHETFDLYETTTSLNIYPGPGANHEELSMKHLPQNTKLEVLEERGVRLMVDVINTVNDKMDIVGWVHSRYIKQVLDWQLGDNQW